MIVQYAIFNVKATNKIDTLALQGFLPRPGYPLAKCLRFQESELSCTFCCQKQHQKKGCALWESTCSQGWSAYTSFRPRPHQVIQI